MKRSRGRWILAPAWLCWLTLQAAGASGPIALEGNWRFRVEAEGLPQKSDYDDHDWASVAVPSNALEISHDHVRSRRIVWYRKSFDVPAVPQRSLVYLVVEEADSLEAWVNGHPVGQSQPGSFALEVPIGERLRAGPNQVTLKTVLPGIRGGVWIHMLPQTHIEPSGLLVDTPGWQGGPAPVRGRVVVRNLSSETHSLGVELNLVGPGGEEIGGGELQDQAIEASGSKTFEVRLSPILSPPLWSPDSPVLSRVTARLHVDGREVHTVTSKFGFRWFRFDPEQGFFLNGRPFPLRGVVYSKTTPRTFPDRFGLWQHEIGLLKGMGVNFVRPAEQGIGESFLEECDRAGLLVTKSVSDRGSPQQIQRNVQRDVRRNYNRPSIVAWHFNGEGKSAAVARQQSEAAKVIRSLDPVRPVLCVELGWRSPGTVGLVDADIAGQGNYTGWYEGTLESIGPYMDDYRDLLRERYGRHLPVVISNYGAAADTDKHADRPRRNDYSHEYHTAFHRRFLREIEARPWVAGSLLFAFRDIQSQQPIPRHTWKGVVDLQERKRDAYFYYQSRWTTDPMVHIAQSSWSPRDVWPPNSETTLEVFSNCSSVELFLNGKSLGQRSRSPRLLWEVALRAGTNRLRAVGMLENRRVESQAVVQVHFRPPRVEPRLLPEDSGSVRLTWKAMDGVTRYSVYGGSDAKVELDANSLIAETTETSFRHAPPRYGFYYRIVPLAGRVAGPPSVTVGRGTGALQWRFPNSGWLFSSPALCDLDNDGNLEIVVASYNGTVFALDREGSERWRFDTGDNVFSSPAVAPLHPGEAPSVVFNSRSHLYLLNARGELVWKAGGVRQFDRSVKSPALADLDGDGEREVLVSSDRGRLLVFSAEGREIWSYSTAGEANRGLALTSPLVVDLSAHQRAVVVAADDGVLYVLSSRGRLLWRHDGEVGEAFPGLVPNTLTPAAGSLEEDGPLRIVTGYPHLKVLDSRGRLVWERRDIGGFPQISRRPGGGRRQILVFDRRIMRAVGPEGEDLWSYSLSHPRDYFTQPPVGADLTADGQPDLVVGTRATTLHALDASGRLLWTFSSADEISGTAAVEDINHDGYMDVVFGSRDGYLYLVGAGAAPQSPLVSRQYRGGPRRTADYSGKPLVR